jgi:hypothetical protein
MLVAFALDLNDWLDMMETNGVGLLYERMKKTNQRRKKERKALVFIEKLVSMFTCGLSLCTL